MTDMCMPFAALERYATGQASAGERIAVERHAGGCALCRSTLAATGLALGRGSTAEEAMVDWVAEARPVSAVLADLGIAAKAPAKVRQAPRRSSGAIRRVRAALGGVAAAAAASLAILLFLPQSVTTPLPTRTSQGRPAALTSYVPFATERGGTAHAWETFEASYSEAMGRDGHVAVLLARGANGDWQRAAELLADVKPTAVSENDRGVLLLAQGMAEPALAAFERALQLDDDLLAASFNRAVALDEMGRFAEARAAWAAYLEVADRDLPGWREEALRRIAARPD